MTENDAGDWVKRIQTGNLDARDFLIIQLQASGSDPSALFEVLEDIVHHERWQEITDGDGLPLGSLRRLLEAPQPTGCGVPAEKVLKLLDIEHKYERTNHEWRARMAVLRQTVHRLLQQDREPSRYDLALPALNTRRTAGKMGGRGRKKAVDTSSASRSGGSGRDYLLARLKRDRPDLAQRVMAGELSAHAAAVEAGFRQRRYTIYPEDLELTASVLRRVLTPEACLHLAHILVEAARRRPLD